VFVVDSRNDRIQVFDRAGQPLGKPIGGRGAEEGKLADPAGAAFDPAGRVLYVAEAGNRRVSAFDAASGAFLFAFARDLESAGGIAVDAAGIVYVTDPAARRVRRYAPAAPRRFRALAPWGHAGKAQGEWTSPQAIAVDARGRVYVVDRSDDRGWIFSYAGALLGSFGEDVELTPVAAAADAPAALPRSVCSTGSTYAVETVKAPDPIPVGELFDLELMVREGCRSARPAEGIQLEVDATMPGHGHGMNTAARVSPLGPGRFLVTGLRFHMPGRWEVDFDVMRGGAVERAQVEVGLE
jgi:sugar lactone lactonase YvrE